MRTNLRRKAFRSALLAGLPALLLAAAVAKAEVADHTPASGEAARSETLAPVPISEEGKAARATRLGQLGWRLWAMAQNLHREASVIEPQFFDEVIEAFSRLGVATDPETGERLVYVTGALAYVPASVLDENPDHLMIADPETPLRVTAEELRDPERIAAARAAIETATVAAPDGVLQAELSPAARERLLDLLVFYERVLTRQAEWLARHWKKDAIGVEEITMASRLIVYITGIDGWSSGYDYLRRAYTVALNYANFQLDVLGRRHGRFDDQKRRQLAGEIAGLELGDGAADHLAELVRGLLGDLWREAQAGIPDSRVYVSAKEITPVIEASLPFAADAEGSVTFLPGSENATTFQDFDMEALRESAFEWRLLADLLWERGRFDDEAAADGSRDLLPLELRAEDRLSDLAARYTVLLLTTAGEQAVAAGETRLESARLEAVHAELLAAGKAHTRTTPANVASTDGVWSGPRPIFDDVTAKAGLQPIADPLVTDRSGVQPSIMSHDAFRGTATADFDRDGLPDLFIAEERGRSRLYRNAGNGGFEDATARSGLDGIERVIGAYFADYDNDGCADLLVLRNHLSSLLYRNRCNGTFEDVTAKSGLERAGLPATGAIWFDSDNDGHLDLYLLLTGDFEKGFVPSRGDLQNAESNVLFVNRGDGTFEDVTARAGVGDRGLALAAAATDFDNDGDQDIYIANDMQRNVLYENLGDGRFRDIARQAGVDDLGNGMGVSVGDVDADGWMDLYLTNISAPTPPRYANTAQTNRLYMNRGNGSFEDVHKAQVGPDLTGWGWNSFFFDLDNDGDLDIYVINGFRPDFQPHNSEPNLLFLARGPEPSYSNVSDFSGVDFDGYSRGGVYLDHDGDGDLDVVLTGLHSPFLFRNRSEALGNGWLRLELVGTRSNRDGFGARVKVVAGGREQVAEMGNQGGNFISSIHGPLHFGLGEAERVDRIEIRWPSGALQTLTDLEANRLHVVTEPEAGAESRRGAP